MKTRMIALIVCLFIAGAGAVWAHGGATGVVKQRMDGMGMLANTVKSLAMMMRGKTAYDVDEVRRLAGVLTIHSGTALTKLFPEGSNAKPSEAKAEIWLDWDSFDELAQQLAVYAGALETAADNDLMASGAMRNMKPMMQGSAMMGVDQLSRMPPDGLFKMVAQTCSSCHSKFRSEKQ